MGYLLYQFFPNARGSGVPQTKAALYARDGVITGRTLFGKFFCTSVTLASGIPLGREGPSVQVGGAIASVLGRHLGLSTEKVKALLPVGAAAAIAATFNTPLAAVLFALEEITGDLHAPILGSVVLGAATSWIVLRLVLGNEPLFAVPQYQLVHPAELIIYGLLGIAGGVVSVAFTKLLLWMRQAFQRFPYKSVPFQPAFGGVIVGAVALLVPQVLGVGYGYVGDALNGRMAFRLMAVLVVLKLIATATSYASGNAGGIFGPSLFIGAMLGGSIGSVAHSYLPQYTASPGAYALVGMGTAFAGIVRAPMTSVLMIFEITRDYAVIVPLMISNLVSYAISSRLQPEPIYEALAVQDGIHLPGAKGERGKDLHPVRTVMREPMNLLPVELSVHEALEKDGTGNPQTWLVLDRERLVGVVTISQLRKIAAEADETLSNIVTSDQFAHVHSDHPLHIALERMGAAGLDLLPVVSRANLHKLEGVVTLSDILRQYGLSPQPG